MIQNSNFIVRNFFVFDSDKNEEQCKICQDCFQGSYTPIMKKHLMEFHEEAFLSELERFKNQAERKTKIEITISPREMKEVFQHVVNYVPPEVLNSASFKNLAEQIFAGLDVSLEQLLDVKES